MLSLKVCLYWCANLLIKAYGISLMSLSLLIISPVFFLVNDHSQLDIYSVYRKRYPKSETPRRLPLNFVKGMYYSEK